MPVDHTSSPQLPARRSGGLLRALLGALLLALVASAALIGWLVWDGKLAIERGVELVGMADKAAPPATAVNPAPPATAALEQHIASLEQRLTRIDLQAAAAEGNTARAEALLVALAARRAVERGAELGYLEEQLRLRFGTARPAAVDAVIGAAKQPVTLVQLSAELNQLTPVLSGEAPEQGAWSRFRRQMSDLFVVHRTAPGTSNVESRLAQAQLLLRTGQVDGAAELVAGLPSRAAAGDWIAKAKRYSGAMQALDQIEQAALSEPEKLKAGNGEAVRQPGPAVDPAPAPTV